MAFFSIGRNKFKFQKNVKVAFYILICVKWELFICSDYYSVLILSKQPLDSIIFVGLWRPFKVPVFPGFSCTSLASFILILFQKSKQQQKRVLLADSVFFPVVLPLLC